MEHKCCGEFSGNIKAPTIPFFSVSEWRVVREKRLCGLALRFPRHLHDTITPMRVWSIKSNFGFSHVPNSWILDVVLVIDGERTLRLCWLLC
mmetsp:Transcript_11386/g.26430  ORF Transcript_11386/g.26430 Transcript_11386/m.26430 type:complete len:92 (+) Transcript_11386:917-1192(+)